MLCRSQNTLSVDGYHLLLDKEGWRNAFVGAVNCSLSWVASSFQSNISLVRTKVRPKTVQHYIISRGEKTLFQEANMQGHSQQQHQQQHDIEVPVMLVAITESNPSDKGNRMKSSCFSKQFITRGKCCWCWQRILQSSLVFVVMLCLNQKKHNCFTMINGRQETRKQFSPM